jgi:hypothetical protein
MSFDPPPLEGENIDWDAIHAFRASYLPFATPTYVAFDDRQWFGLVERTEWCRSNMGPRLYMKRTTRNPRARWNSTGTWDLVANEFRFISAAYAMWFTLRFRGPGKHRLTAAE